MQKHVKEEEKITPEQFIYWLQGFIEIEDPKFLNEKQLSIIKDHLNLVFKKVTPNYNIPLTIPGEDKGNWLYPNPDTTIIC